MAPAIGDMIDRIVRECKPASRVCIVLKCGREFRGDVISADDYVLTIRSHSDAPPTQWAIDVHEIAAFTAKEVR